MQPTTAIGVQVIVVGGGPTGLMAANLLGVMGISVLLVERNASTSDDAKAISLDDESMRALQLAGLDEAVYPIIVPGTGTKYFGARGQTLVHARGPGARFGHPFKNPFAQPEFERVLREGLRRFPHVEVLFDTALAGLHDDGDHVRACLDGGTRRDVRARYLLGCDGGRSTVREMLGVGMTGRSHDDVWLVVDTLEDTHDERYGMHHGDPRRPHLLVPGRDGRCRYEFLLRPGELAAAGAPSFDLVRDLLAPYRTVEPAQVERSVAYRFHALLADRFRVGRSFLLGDAAHMMPPFAGQGMNSGLRDATNLAWKLTEVLSGRAADPLLDTYEAERRPHARATIDFSVRLGAVVFTTDRRRAAVRDLLVASLMRTRRGRRYLACMRYRPSARFTAGAVAPLSGSGPSRSAQGLVGSPLPQPYVLAGEHHRLLRLDDALGAGWTLLGVAVDDADWATPALGSLPGRRVDVMLDDRAARSTGGRPAITDADGTLNALLAECRGHLIAVRPDRVVAAVFHASDARRVLDALRAAGAIPSPDRARTPSSRQERSHESQHHPVRGPDRGSPVGG